MGDFLYHLEVITLLVVLIWLVASVRQSLLNTPGPMTHVKRVVRRIGEAGNVHTSRKNRPTDSNLVSLDQMNPDDALEAVEKYFDGDSR